MIVNIMLLLLSEVNVVEKMKECNAIIGGEGNGGIITLLYIMEEMHL